MPRTGVTDKQNMKQINYNDLIGAKYTVHGRSKEEGFDCYGLTIEVLKRNGIKLKDVFYEDIENKLAIHDEALRLNVSERMDKPVKNCIVLINIRNQPTHSGVYIGDGFMIHCTNTYGVVIEPLRKYSKRVEGYYKVINN